MEVVSALLSQTQLLPSTKIYALAHATSIESDVGLLTKMKKSKKVSKRMKHVRKCQCPDIEELLYSEYETLRRQGFKVKAFWSI